MEESPHPEVVCEVHVGSLAALLGKVQDVLVALYVGGRGVDAVCAQQSEQFGVELSVVACQVEVEIELPPHSHLHLSEDCGPCLALGIVVEELSDGVAARHVLAHLVHCEVGIEVGAELACTHNLYRSLVEVAYLMSGTPYVVVVGHKVVVVEYLVYLLYMVLCAVCGRCHVGLVVVEGDGTVEIVELYTVYAFVPAHYFVVPAEHVVPPVDGIGDGLPAAVACSYPLLLHVVDVAVALYLNHGVCGKVACDVAPVLIGVAALVPVTVYNTVLNVDLDVGVVGEHLAAVVCVNIVAHEQGRVVEAYRDYVEAYLKSVERAAGVCAEHLLESEECTVLYLALYEHIDKLVSVGVDTCGVVKS